MPFITQKCSKCGKIAETEKEFQFQNKTLLKLKCGHLIEKENCSSPEQIISLDGKKLYPFQCDGVRFIENANGRAIIGDEMGLGKTIQGIGTLILHPEMLPALAIVKATLKTQWQKEFLRWGGEDFFSQVIDSPNDFILPGLKAYILSYDIIRRFIVSRKEKANFGLRKASDLLDYTSGTITETEKSKEKGRLKDLVESLGIKTIILDEVQQIKNPESQRSILVREMCKHVPYVISLSGTVIKNHAGEFFPVLHITRPDLYPKFSTFLRNDCDSYFNGYSYKIGGLRYPEAFKEKTKSFILRRTRKEVMPDLPPINRTFQFHELSKEVEKAYIETFKQFRDDYNSSGYEEDSFGSEGRTLAYLSKMRHLVGLSLIDQVIDYVMELMGSTDDRVTIFTHHIDVAEKLIEKLNLVFKEINIPPCAYHKAGTSALETESNFKKSRVLVCSTLAGGEGLNLQRLCFRFIMMERQWNPANEEQAEARFPRPEGLNVDKIEGVYFTAVGTVNEFFAEIVERKREIVGKTLDGKAVEWDQSSLMKELAETLASSGGRRWSI